MSCLFCTGKSQLSPDFQQLAASASPFISRDSSWNHLPLTQRGEELSRRVLLSAGPGEKEGERQPFHSFLSVPRDILIYSFIYLFNMYLFFWKSEICNLVTMYIFYPGGMLNKPHLYHSLAGTVPSELFLEPSNLELGKEKLLPHDSNQPLHLPDESTEAPRVEGTCPRSHS